MSYRNARTPEALHQDQDEKFVLVQWHNGTDSRQDDLPDGGWEIERKNYPGLRIPLKVGKVLHSNASVEAWIAEALSMAILDHKLTWFIDDKSQATARNPRGAVEITAYQPGAWSRLRVLAWCGELDMPVVFTMRASIAADFVKALHAFQNGLLARARRENPDLPLCAFWLTVSPGPREKRGTGGASSWITPPRFELPAEDADDATVEQWLEDCFVGQEMLDRMAEQAPVLIERFRGIGRGAPKAAPPATEEPPANPTPTGARCAKGHVYDTTQWFVCPVCAQEEARLKEQIQEEARAKAEFEAARTRQEAAPDAQPAQGERNGANHDRGDTSDGFDSLPSATEDPAVQSLLAEAAVQAAARQPVMPEPSVPTSEPKEQTWDEALSALARSHGIDPSEPRVRRVIDAAVKSHAPAAYAAAEKTIAAMK